MSLNASWTSADPCSQLIKLASSGKNPGKLLSNQVSPKLDIACRVEITSGAREASSLLLADPRGTFQWALARPSDESGEDAASIILIASDCLSRFFVTISIRVLVGPHSAVLVKNKGKIGKCLLGCFLERRDHVRPLVLREHLPSIAHQADKSRNTNTGKALMWTFYETD
ncbi:Vps51/Vps67 family (components of vesiculartransport) protein [Striga asiatica]|uniref:Vps51/Vps67 family (Components of vesiculartransport) protein n=1 Tax=Striga asiatica TaxID=4170 RepID=A0A5A7PFC1_STRAF|nr:Vps51/Vps67 family (components of vesiculartransport) protein [Striga asiatica]